MHTYVYMTDWSHIGHCVSNILHSYVDLVDFAYHFPWHVHMCFVICIQSITWLYVPVPSAYMANALAGIFVYLFMSFECNYETFSTSI